MNKDYSDPSSSSKQLHCSLDSLRFSVLPQAYNEDIRPYLVLTTPDQHLLITQSSKFTAKNCEIFWSDSFSFSYAQDNPNNRIKVQMFDYCQDVGPSQGKNRVDYDKIAEGYIDIPDAAHKNNTSNSTDTSMSINSGCSSQQKGSVNLYRNDEKIGELEFKLEELSESMPENILIQDLLLKTPIKHRIHITNTKQIFANILKIQENNQIVSIPQRSHSRSYINRSTNALNTSNIAGNDENQQPHQIHQISQKEQIPSSLFEMKSEKSLQSPNALKNQLCYPATPLFPSKNVKILSQKQLNSTVFGEDNQKLISSKPATVTASNSSNQVNLCNQQYQIQNSIHPPSNQPQQMQSPCLLKVSSSPFDNQQSPISGHPFNLSSRPSQSFNELSASIQQLRVSSNLNHLNQAVIRPIQSQKIISNIQNTNFINSPSGLFPFQMSSSQQQQHSLASSNIPNMNMGRPCSQQISQFNNPSTHLMLNP